jgi:hypothetical protein
LTWEYAFNQFEKYAEWYAKENNKAPVIVIDNINRLANKAPEILDILQEGAKDAVGSGLYTAVFVTSDGSAADRMQGNQLLLFQRAILSRGQIFFVLKIWTRTQCFNILKSEVCLSICANSVTI